MAEISIGTTKKLFLAVVAMIIISAAIGSILGILLKSKTQATIETLPRGAVFKIKDKIYETPAKISGLKEGNLELTLSKKGYFDRKVTINLRKESENNFKFRLYTKKTSPGVVLSDINETAKTVDPLAGFFQALPHKDKNFIIAYHISDGESVVTITLLAVLNSADQRESYEKQLFEYKQEAITWIESKGVSLKDLNILWEPKEAKDF